MPTDEQIEAAARAWDREESAQMGEPSPWEANLSDVEFHRFKSERLACARAALEAAEKVRPEGQMYEVLLMTSHCPDNPGCTDERPCPICLGMSNVFSIAKADLGPYLRQLASDWNASHVLEEFSSALSALTTEGE